ncbi:MAG: helix-turn-helix domain-containing protein [bacterium]|nr:helix-turn-helix domain-containing protein [bacterium]
MNPAIERELSKLGLSEKEAKVYLSALELGPQPVQDIARKAGVNRATTYVMIEVLMQRGLMTSFERGKKRLFSAEPPDRLLSLIRVKERELQEQEREFSQVLPELRAILASSGERPRVRFFEGAEGLRAIREEILAADAKEMWTALDATGTTQVLNPQENAEFDRRLREKGVLGCQLYVGVRSAEDLQRAHPHWQFRNVPAERCPITGEITVFGSKIFAFTIRGKLIGAVIESEELANTLRSVFKLAWDGAARPPATA